jgi:hypothetical protein
MSVRHCLRAAPAVAGLVLAAAAHAQSHISPGLWEQKMTLKTDNAQMEAQMAKMKEQLAAMPPDKRAMMEQMMAAKGIGMGANANTFRLCVSKEQAERDMIAQHDGRCSQQEVTRSGNTLKYKYTCQMGKDGSRTVSGQSEFTLNGTTGYTGHSVTDMTMLGKPTHSEADVVGKWLGSDCGDVKPMQVPSAPAR